MLYILLALGAVFLLFFAGYVHERRKKSRFGFTPGIVEARQAAYEAKQRIHNEQISRLIAAWDPLIREVLADYQRTHRVSGRLFTAHWGNARWCLGEVGGRATCIVEESWDDSQSSFAYASIKIDANAIEGRQLGRALTRVLKKSKVGRIGGAGADFQENLSAPSEADA